MFATICRSCRLRPNELHYVLQHSAERGIEPETYVKLYDPTYESDENTFLCQLCERYGYRED